MTNHTKTSPLHSLFARKGEAEPAPAVAYMSLKQLQENPERGEEGPVRWTQWGERQGERVSPDRRDRHASDHDDRRRFTPRIAHAMDQPYAPWTASEDKADTPEDSARIRNQKTSVSPLSSLIHRHRDGVAQPASRGPVPLRVVAIASPATSYPELESATPQRLEARPAAGPTKIDLSYLSTSSTRGRRPVSPELPDDSSATRAGQPSTTYKLKILRRQVTVRLEIHQFLKIKALADNGGKTRQNVMATAIAAYLDKIV